MLVARPDRGALRVAASAAAELSELGIDHQTLVVNGVLAHPLAGTASRSAYAAAQRTGPSSSPRRSTGCPSAMVPLVAIDLVGVAALRQTHAAQRPAPHGRRSTTADAPTFSVDRTLDRARRRARTPRATASSSSRAKAASARRPSPRRIAVELADAATTSISPPPTPPGSHPRSTEGLPQPEHQPRSTPTPQTRDYVAGRLDAASRSGLDQQHLDLLAEDLRSPCSQSSRCSRRSASCCGRGRNEFVVIDTAPTGHTLLLLDLTGSFHRQVMQGAGQPLGRVVTPLMWLQDPDRSRLLIVTLG